MCVNSSVTKQLQNPLTIACAQCALSLLCHDGAAGVDVARDEARRAVQLRPLGKRHHQGGAGGARRGSL